MFTARVCAAIMTCLLFSLVLFVCLLFVLFCFLKSRVIADNSGHDPEHPVNEISHPPIPRDLHYSVHRYSVTRFIQV